MLVRGGAGGSRVVEVGEGRAAAAVAVHVDVCRQHRAAHPLGRVGARGWLAGPGDRRDGGDALALDCDEDVGQHDVVDEGRSAQHGVHRP